MTLSIRLVERRDVPEIMDIEERQFPEPWTRGMLLDEITNTETRRYSVAHMDSRLVGCLGLMFVLHDELHITTLGVHPDFEGHGVARALLDEGLAAATARGVTRATLEVAVSNQRAIDLYYRYGFRPVGVRKNYYQTINEDALILWADLAPDSPSASDS